ncbi:bacillolysin [Microdochium nivale]|nr:bacillolysin [Microdochium nivale]
MAPVRCFIVPPYLLSAIADSTDNAHEIRESARRALHHQAYAGRHRSHREHLASARVDIPPPSQCIVPPYILDRITSNEPDHSRGLALEPVADEQNSDRTQACPKPVGKKHRAIFDAQHSMNEADLPGDLLRAEGQKPVTDEAANKAYNNTGKVLDFYAKLFDWQSIDNKNARIISTVHFGRQYENAFWDSEARQMVYGDGHDFITNFTSAVDVIGHEITHAVTEHTAPLNYVGQAGALNESISDVFGIMIKQLAQNEKADEADWLIGEDCLCPGVKGVALRSMKAPGTAYDDPRFGKDPQPAHMRDFRITKQDNGGVHLYSGIPNKAFQLIAVAFGGYSWEKAGKIWWKTLRSGQIGPNCKFIHFADVTVEVAEETFGKAAAIIVRKAWNQVGVTRHV